MEGENIREQWDHIKEVMRQEYNMMDITFDTWIAPLKFYELADNTVYIIVPDDKANAFSYISNKYKDFFQVTISEMFNHTYDVVFVLEKNTASPSDNREIPASKPVYNINYEDTNSTLL